MADPFTAMLVLDVAMMGASMLLAPKIQGPRLDDLSVSLADYGTQIPRFWGIRRLQPQLIWAEKLHEVKVETKTKGGKYDQYKYYGTWAALICDHQIDDVSRIWFDKRLVYDRTHKGVFALGALANHLLDGNSQKLAIGSNFRLYRGTEDQMPDRRMEAWCEDRYGPDSCPAYRGSSYMVFQSIPLELAGNRIPQQTVEAVNNKAPIYPYEQIEGGGLSYLAPQAIGGDWFIRYTNGQAGNIEWWDLATRTYIGMSSGGDAAGGSVYNVDLTDDGTAYYVGNRFVGVDVVTSLYRLSPLGVASSSDIDNYANVGPTRVFESSDGLIREIYTGRANEGYLLNGVYVPSPYGRALDFARDIDGNIWGLFEPSGTSNSFTLWQIHGDTNVAYSNAGLVTRTVRGDASFCHCGEFPQFFVVTDGKWYLVDDDTTATPGNISASGSFSGRYTTNLPRKHPGADSFWSEYTHISLEDGSVIETIDAIDWVNEDSGSGEVITYAPILDALIAHAPLPNHITVRYLGRFGSDGVALGDVVDDVSTWCGLTGQDTTELTQTVLGYSVTQGLGKDMIGPLLDIHDVDARPHDFTVQFKVRGSAPSGTILTEDMVRNGDRYKVTIKQDTDLTRDVTINFADVDGDQQPNNVKSTRPAAATSSNRAMTIDLTTYVDSANSAQQKADRFIRREWNSRESVEASVTAQLLALEPGDVKTLSLDGVLRNARLNKMTIAGQQIDCEFIRDETSFAALNPATIGPPMDGRDDEEIIVPSITRGFVLDIPLIQDADENTKPLLYLAAGGYSDPWPGAIDWRGDDGTYDERIETFDTSNEATWGLATDSLDGANPNLWDRGNTLNVKILNGTLTTYTEAEIDADTTLNLVAYGSQANGYEIIQFATATLESDGTYTLSNFKRGRRGTEWAVDTHVAGDEFVLLNKAINETVGLDDLAAAMKFKAVTVGRSVDAAAPINLTYTGASLKPYAPARIKWATDGTDMFGEIIRRTRVGGAWIGSTTIPLSENSEAYEVDIYHGATLKRTISVSGTNLFTYTGTQIAADSNTVGVAPPYEAYQLSDAVGRGFALAA
jgi:hypothetical protein